MSRVKPDCCPAGNIRYQKTAWVWRWNVDRLRCFFVVSAVSELFRLSSSFVSIKLQWRLIRAEKPSSANRTKRPPSSQQWSEVSECSQTWNRKDEHFHSESCRTKKRSNTEYESSSDKDFSTSAPPTHPHWAPPEDKESSLLHTLITAAEQKVKRWIFHDHNSICNYCRPAGGGEAGASSSSSSSSIKQMKPADWEDYTALRLFICIFLHVC